MRHRNGFSKQPAFEIDRGSPSLTLDGAADSDNTVLQLACVHTTTRALFYDRALADKQTGRTRFRATSVLEQACPRGGKPRPSAK